MLILIPALKRRAKVMPTLRVENYQSATEIAPPALYLISFSR
ncbi:MAG: hypothetical protein ABI596_08480 [Pyrinomonadaceae bacterium]